MFIRSCSSYLEYIGIAKVERNSGLGTDSVRVKGTYHGHLLRTNADFSAPDSVGPFLPYAHRCASQD